MDLVRNFRHSLVGLLLPLVSLSLGWTRLYLAAIPTGECQDQVQVMSGWTTLTAGRRKMQAGSTSLLGYTYLVLVSTRTRIGGRPSWTRH